MAYLQLAENYLAAAPMEMYIFIPAGFRGNDKDIYVREDMFDNLPEMEYRAIMDQLAPYQPQGLSAKGDKKAARKAERAAKKEGKGGAARREAKQKRVETRAAARGEKGGLFGKAIDAATNIFGKKDLEFSGKPGEFELDYKAPPEGEESFFSKYKLPILIGGGALVAGAIYLGTRKKK
jgi:hypothetical protein